MDAASIVLGVLALISIVFAFVMSLLEMRDGRKKVLGFYAKDIKRYAAFLTLFLTLSTFMVQTKKEIDSNSSAMNAQKKEDERRRKEAERELTRFSKLTIQNIESLKHTEDILSTQKKEVEN